MSIKQLLVVNNLSTYKCAKISGIPYTTLREIVCGDTRIEKCNVDTVFRLSKVLRASMEELVTKHSSYNRIAFETFKGNVCHLVKDKGDIGFILDTLKTNLINNYWEKNWYPEAFYLLGMIDYLSNTNNIPLCKDYDDIRSKKLKTPILPRDISLTKKIKNTLDYSKNALKEAIPEFLQFNIIENEVRNVY
jgi:hypothetical protein